MASGLVTRESERLAYALGADLVVEKIVDRDGHAWIPTAAILAHVEQGIAIPSLDREALEKLARVERDHVIDVIGRPHARQIVSAMRSTISRLRRPQPRSRRRGDRSAATRR
jgi:hypothetical protein